MKKRKIWNIEEFNKINLPEVLDFKVDKKRFSEDNKIRVLDLPIFMPEQGFKIPDYLEQFKDIIEAVYNYEKQYDLKDHYIYITVDQKEVKSGNTGRRAGAHSDAYIEKENVQVDVISENVEVIKKEKDEVSHTYIVTDTLPTEFFEEKFPLTKTDCEGSIKTFNEIAENAKIITYPVYTILKLDPYVIHRSAISNIDQKRTFVKISFSKKRYSRKGNTINPEFDYNWKMKDRQKEIRNHPW